MTEIVSRSDVGIDLHTGSAHRTNLPQVRGNFADEPTRELAKVFGAPVALQSSTRDGSLRQAATEAGASVLLYEAGEALRFDSNAIAMGTAGVQRVLSHVGITNDASHAEAPVTEMSQKSRWVRAVKSGVCHLDVELGERVEHRQVVGMIVDPFGNRLGLVRAPAAGIAIGRTLHPLANRGDAILHIAELG